jgi:hypothetical protein
MRTMTIVQVVLQGVAILFDVSWMLFRPQRTCNSALQFLMSSQYPPCPIPEPSSLYPWVPLSRYSDDLLAQ